MFSCYLSQFFEFFLETIFYPQMQETTLMTKMSATIKGLNKFFFMKGLKTIFGKRKKHPHLGLLFEAHRCHGLRNRMKLFWIRTVQIQMADKKGINTVPLCQHPAVI